MSIMDICNHVFDFSKSDFSVNHFSSSELIRIVGKSLQDFTEKSEILLWNSGNQYYSYILVETIVLIYLPKQSYKSKTQWRLSAISH